MAGTNHRSREQVPRRPRRGPAPLPEMYARSYDARAVRRGAGVTWTRTGAAGAGALARVTTFAAFARAAVAFRALVAKQISSAPSTFTSTAGVFSPITSVISDTTRNFARSSIRFSRNERLLDLLRNVKLFSTSTTS